MTTVSPTISLQGDGSILVVWAGLAASGDDGAPVSFPDLPDRTVAFEGGWGTSVAVKLVASLEPASPSVFHDVTDGQGNAISKIANGAEAIAEDMMWFKPLATAGSGGAVNVRMKFRGRPR